MAAVLDSPWTGQSFTPATAIDINSIEQAIVAQLQAAIDNTVEVAHYPDRPERYRLTHRIGAALVIYAGSDYGKLLGIDLVEQDRTLHFNIVVVIRDLGWSYGGPAGGPSPGAYQLLEGIRTALTGFQPTGGGCRKMWPVRERFLERDREGGAWLYEIAFATSTRAIENYQAPNFPLFITGTFQEEMAQTTIAMPAAQYTFSGTPGKIQLPNGNISAVTVSSLSGQAYLLKTDYSLDTVNGTVSRIAGGAIAANATVNVAYSYSEIVTAVYPGSGTAPFNPSN